MDVFRDIEITQIVVVDDKDLPLKISDVSCGFNVFKIFGKMDWKNKSD